MTVQCTTGYSEDTLATIDTFVLCHDMNRRAVIEFEIRITDAPNDILDQ